MPCFSFQPGGRQIGAGASNFAHLTASRRRVTTRSAVSLTCNDCAKPSTQTGYPVSFNTFGHMFRVTTFGESHGVAIGCVVDGCPPLLPLIAEDIQHDLDRRRPGQSRFTTQRQEPDKVKILSGVMAHPETAVQVTTGTPIGLLIENMDQRSKDYSDIKDKFRPGHADFTYDAKYGLRD